MIIGRYSNLIIAGHSLKTVALAILLSVYTQELNHLFLYQGCQMQRHDLACFGTLVTSLSNFWNYFVWLRITQEG